MRSVLFLILLAVLALVGAYLLMPIQPPQPQPQPQIQKSARVGLRPDAPEYGKRGPFWVGYRSWIIDGGTDHPLKVELWYPALNPKGIKEKVTYEFAFQKMLLNLPGWPSDIPSVVQGHALRNAAMDESGAPYPLVIFSHGFGLNAAWYSTLLEHYASYGFVVLAPQHVDPDWSDAWKAAIDRPRVVKRTLDYAEQLTAPGGEMAGQIDMSKVAVVGHSFGGYTALALGGARLDLKAFHQHYAEIPSDDPKVWLVMPFVDKEADMAARAGLDFVPEGLWPSFGDPRVTAIVPMASDAFLFGQAGLSKITIPLLAIGGTADTGAPYDWGTQPAYEYASSVQKALVALEGAEHMIMTDPCENMPWVTKLPSDFYKMFCLDPVWDKRRALDLINHFSTAFLLDMLKGDADAHAALLPNAVRFPGIHYETTFVEVAR